MKDLFEGGARILGIYFFYYFVSNFFLFGISFYYYFDASFDKTRLFGVISYGSLMITPLIFSYILIFKTRYLSSFFKIKDSQGLFDGKAIVSSGIILIGIYIFAVKSGRLFSDLWKDFRFIDFEGGLTSQGADFLGQVITIVISLLLIFNSEKIERFISRTGK